jgi:hypothetical protein
MRAFYARYGGFLLLWQTFELLIEVAIMRELRLSHEEVCIVCGGLNYAAKISILLALLKRDPSKAEAMRALRHASQTAERNDFTHSFLTRGDTESDPMRLIRRVVKDGTYKVDGRPATKDDMQQHGDEFASMFERAANALGITESDIDAYASAIEAHGQNP